jgi:hypothetical protein
MQAPDVDGQTFVRGIRARRGQLVSALIVDSLGYDVEAIPGTGEA